VILRRWKRRGDQRYEDRLLLKYCRKMGGTIYAEVPIVKDEPAAGSERRYLDGVRILPAVQSKAKAEIITFTSGTSKKFLEAITGKELEVIEVKRKLNRPVIGQVMVGADVFKSEYGCERVKSVILCAQGDTLLQKFCDRHHIEVVQVRVKEER
jgi:hypothetical protein